MSDFVALALSLRATLHDEWFSDGVVLFNLRRLL